MFMVNVMMLFLIVVVLISAILLRIWLRRRASERNQRGFEVITGPERMKGNHGDLM